MTDLPLRAAHPSAVLRLSTLGVLAVAGTLALGACAPSDAPEAGDDASAAAQAEGSWGPTGTPGRLVIVGGGLDSDTESVYRAVLEAREGDGPFCVMPTASGVPERSMNSSIERFREYGAEFGQDSLEVTGIWITTENMEAASDPAVVDSIAACSGYWFVGGVQDRIVQTFRPAEGDTPAYDALMRRWNEGAVVAGSSAGAAMMSSRSIGGGSPAEALEVGVARDVDGDWEPDGDGVWVLPGMDFVPWAILGQHHLARGRWGRLVVATMVEQDELGIGIDENTALVVDHGPDGPVGEVVGASSVLVVDVSDAEVDADARTAEGIRLELLGAGDRIDLSTGEVTRRTIDRFPPEPGIDVAASGDPDETLVEPTLEEIRADPFARWAFLHLLHQMATSETFSDVTLDGGARELYLRPGGGATALADPTGEPVEGAGTPWGLSVGPVMLDVRMPGM
ncbi:MAG TPA: cyanophycinase [Longimicrobiales bacterium]|nr:cyanophycinase [Longimicrobiales bacterium]